MLGQIIDSIAAVVVLGLVVLFALALLSPWWLWLWPTPRREREERVIIVNNQPSLQAPPSGPGAGSILALALAGLLVALTRRVDSQALPAPTEPTDLPARYYDYRG